MKHLNQLLPFLNYLQIIGDKEISIYNIAYNSNKISSNSLFVAISGNTTDGHNFINQAIKNGAVAIICEKLPDTIMPNISYILVADSRLALAQLSNAWFDFPAKDIKTIGVTGTNGKTTITFLIASLLKHFHKSVAIIGTTGIYLNEENIPATHTTPESLELFELFAYFRSKNVEYVVMEVSSHSLVQHRVFGVNFISAIFTNLSHDHLDFHKTMGNYAQAKQILFKSLEQNSSAIINQDDKYSDLIVQDCGTRQIYTIGRYDNSLIKILNENTSISSISFDLELNDNIGNDIGNIIDSSIKNNCYKVKSNLIGKFNIENLAFSIICLYSLGFNLEELINSAKQIQAPPGRMQLVKLPNEAIGIVDYAHTPDALMKVLQNLNAIKEQVNISSKIICVFGCGGDRDKEKRPKMGNIAVNYSDYVIITSDNPRNEEPNQIIQEILTGIPSDFRNKVQTIESRYDAIRAAYKISRKNDYIVIAGKGHEKYQIIGSSKINFDDFEILNKIE
jgi:UDP-N-acetylmuramoyl-L-alanyl-D-glutamate--2,6-diaminopimelate ligase